VRRTFHAFNALRKRNTNIFIVSFWQKLFFLPSARCMSFFLFLILFFVKHLCFFFLFMYMLIYLRVFFSLFHPFIKVSLSEAESVGTILLLFFSVFCYYFFFVKFAVFSNVNHFSIFQFHFNCRWKGSVV